MINDPTVYLVRITGTDAVVYACTGQVEVQVGRAELGAWCEEQPDKRPWQCWQTGRPVAYAILFTHLALRGAAESAALLANQMGNRFFAEVLADNRSTEFEIDDQLLNEWLVNATLKEVRDQWGLLGQLRRRGTSA